MTSNVPKPMFVVVLTEGNIDEDMKKAIEGQGYELKRHSDYEGYVTNEFKRKEVIHVV